MKLLLIYLALFSCEEKYVASEMRCGNNEVEIMYENNWYSIELFNVFVEDGVNVCEYVGGENYSVEFEPLVALTQPYQAYVFIDDELLQQKLIEEEKATIKINNPNYAYVLTEKDLAVEVIAEAEEEKEYSSRNTAIYIIIGWIVILVIYFLFKKLF